MEQKWGFHNTPVYRKVREDLLLIGVVHRPFRFPGQTTKVNEFKNRLGKLEHLIFEGTEVSREMSVTVRNFLERTYEDIAFTSFKGKKHFLDDQLDMDYASLLLGYGITINMFGLIKAFAALQMSARRCGSDSEAAVREMVSYMDVGKMLYSGMDRVNTTEAIENAILAAVRVSEELGKPNVVGDVFKAFETFLARVRDAKIYGPRIVEIARTLPGRKGVTMGANHIESIERILGGSTIELSWKTYVEGLDEDTRRGMRIVEEIAKLQ